ncbi:MAG: HlyD family efflux transporter periplasmic adaptor subunit [Lachnospiraceae bacterium]|nr:HlyD family efflux transporter periplasmic adaptor subunit [Lachnospiraceae bacterium]
MKFREFCGRHRKQCILVAVLALAAAVVLIGVIWYFVLHDTESGSTLQGSAGMDVSAVSGMDLSNAVTASGVTSVGMISETWEVEDLSNVLYVEEVYISSSDEVAEGEAILKLNEDSVEEARELLEEALREAELAYRTGVIEYQQSLITAEYDRDMALANAEYAQTTYDNTVANLASSVERAQEELDEAEEQIAEYEELINSGDYYSYYNVAELKALYDDNRELLNYYVDLWDLDWSSVTGGGSSMGGSSMGASAGSNDQLLVAQEIYAMLVLNEEDYEEALAAYEDAVQNAELNLQSLQLSLSSLKEALAEAQENYETQVLQAKLTLESTQTNAERAESDYETAVEAAESTYESLLDDYEDAQENLELFESTVGDGYYYAQGSGSVLSVTLRAGSYLSSDSVIFVYNNSDEVTVTVSVDQADIASISVGESVYVQSDESGLYSGSVTSINPISSSSSRASVTYDVTVTLSGDVQNLSSNETVTVIFGVSMGDAGTFEENGETESSQGGEQ